jgi:hypothetical protein
LKKIVLSTLLAGMLSLGAFDANTSGNIVTNTDTVVNGFIKEGYNPNFDSSLLVKSGYINGNDANGTLRLSNTFGDALIYPAFRTEDGWGTNIRVTNASSTSAVVAKVVLYSSTDSRELLDFNIYLSANDVFDFDITAEGVKTSDDSIEIQATKPWDVSSGSDADAVIMNSGSVRTISSKLPVNSGYVIIYAMAEAKDDATVIPATGSNTITAASYHKDHEDLFLDYRELLDACRTDVNSTGNYQVDDGVWRSALSSAQGIKNGMMTYQVASPNQLETCTADALIAGTLDYKNKVKFVDPDPVLFGTVSITNTANEIDARNILLNATALENFTDNSLMIWTAGELATLTDRRINSDLNSSNAAPDYNVTGIVQDAKAFEIKTAYYEFKDSEIQNTLHITSPMKRPLVQLLGNTSYWSNVSASSPYGGYDIQRTIRNTSEDKYVASTASGIITSPYTGTVNPTTLITNESGGLQNLQDGSGYSKGYVEVDFVNNPTYPGIVTQMSASIVEGKPEINWVYAPVER